MRLKTLSRHGNWLSVALDSSRFSLHQLVGHSVKCKPPTLAPSLAVPPQFFHKSTSLRWDFGAFYKKNAFAREHTICKPLRRAVATAKPNRWGRALATRVSVARVTLDPRQLNGVVGARPLVFIRGAARGVRLAPPGGSRRRRQPPAPPRPTGRVSGIPATPAAPRLEARGGLAPAGPSPEGGCM